MMSARAAIAKAIDWHKVFRVTFRFVWAAIVFAFRLVLIAFSFIIGLIAAGDNDDKRDDEDESCRKRLENQDNIHKIDFESRSNLYKNDTRF
jgi:hypothetical protein